MKQVRRGVWMLLALTMLVAVGACGSTENSAKFGAVRDALSSADYYIEDGSPNIDIARIESAIATAADAGVDLRAAVFATPDDPVAAKEITGEFGGTAVIFTPDRYDISTVQFGKNRLDQSEVMAESQLKNAPAAEAIEAFVAAVVANADVTGGESGGIAWWVWLLAAIVALLLLWMIWRAIAGRSRLKRQQEDFNQRRVVLQQWAGTLAAPVQELQGSVAGHSSGGLKDRFNGAVAIANESVNDIATAKSLPDLDRAEMRIARAHMTLRDIREHISAGN